MRIRKDTVLSVCACVGVVATTISAIFGTKRYLEEVYRLDEELTRKDKVLLAMKSFFPLAVSGGATITAILGANKSATKVIAGLSSTAVYLAHDRDRLKSLADISKHQMVDGSPIYIPQVNGNSIEETGCGDVLCIEGYSGRAFYSSETAVAEAVFEFKRRFNYGEYVCLNDLYYLLNITPSHFGHQFGWAPNSDYYDGPLDIEVTYINNSFDNKGKPTGKPCVVIDIYTYPMECWQEV